eukprot:331169-Pelagomonas_calceolata.AAC.1
MEKASVYGAPMHGQVTSFAHTKPPAHLKLGPRADALHLKLMLVVPAHPTLCLLILVNGY